MKVLFVASECAPFVKTGGLADVIGAVPKTLAGMGVSVRVMLPAYPALAEIAASGEAVLELDDLHGGPARLIAASAAGLDLLLLDAPHLFDRPGNIYLDMDGIDWADNALRFGALAQVGARVALEGAGGWRPDVVNAHDWQAGLIPAYLHQAREGGAADVPASVMTIHNIAFQGLVDAGLMGALNLSPALYTSEGAEYYGHLGMLKAGVAFADRITTVSPTYAREILTPEFGMGLEGILGARRGVLSGILNGIDTEVWDPAADAALAAPYSAADPGGKAANRAALAKRFDLRADTDGPLFCVVSRLTGQKGLDLLLDALPALVARGGRLALLGSGDRDMEAAFVGAAHRHAGSVGVIVGYDETLSHMMQGGADAILIPSRFEPCGLTQLYGLRYGTVPVVARTGGLADTVIDANDAALEAGCATGVQFAPVTAPALAQAIERTCDLYADRPAWEAIVANGMAHPVGWDRAAREYLTLYEDACA